MPSPLSRLFAALQALLARAVDAATSVEVAHPIVSADKLWAKRILGPQ